MYWRILFRTNLSVLLIVLMFFLLFCPFVSGGDPQSSSDNDGTTAPSQNYEVTLEKDYITMSDGTRLAVLYYKPVPKEGGEKFPVLFEMDPYREDDVSFLEDYYVGMYFAKRGYVVAMVDVRGTGRSEGTVPDREYSEQELSDGVQVIDQLAHMEWSTGKVGMFGMSWSGFNALMIAGKNPPALKAILIAHASDDLFYQDVHSADGVFHMDIWESMIDTLNAIPAPDRYDLSEQFYSDRFDQKPWHFVWKENQKDGPFWRDESQRFSFPVTIPTYLIGGLLDGYRDTIPRIMDSAKGPVKADIGPWNHEYPNIGKPGPNYEWREKAVSWWDYWLKDIDNGIVKEPRFMVYMRDGYPPSTSISEVPGEWRCGDWPVKGIEQNLFYPAPGNTLATKAPEQAGGDVLAYSPGAGTTAGTWWGDLTDDMAGDDRYSLVYDSEPLSNPVEIMGMPAIHLKVSADAPLYQWTARLEDVWPDGKVSLVSGVLINPADRVSRLDRRPLTPGSQEILSGDIHYTTWRFNSGHKIRLSVSNAQFPMAWPTPFLGNTTLYPGSDTSLSLPVVVTNTLTGACSLPPLATEGENPNSKSISGADVDLPVSYNPETGETTYTASSDQQWNVNETLYHSIQHNIWKVKDTDPAHAKYSSDVSDGITLGDRVLNVSGLYTLDSDGNNFNLTVIRRIFENGELKREKVWNELIPRDNQ